MVPIVKGFCDFSVSRKYDFTKLKLFEKLGYSTIAVNTYLEENPEEPKKRKKKGEVRDKLDFIPPPAELPADVLKDTSLQILQRLTIEFSDSIIAHKLNQSTNLKNYHVIAVVPKTTAAFQYACGSMDIDLITFQPESKVPFKLSKKLYRQATDRGISFEIMYSPAIRDATSRKNIINTAHQYHSIGKSKNIIITSSAENHMQVRGIYDVMNLGIILGLKSSECQEAIKDNAHKLFLRSELRRRGKSFMYIITTDEVIAKNNEEENVTSEPQTKKIKLQ